MSLQVPQDTIGGESYATRNRAFTVTAANRLLKFNHRYDADLGIDGGRVEVSTDQGNSWIALTADEYLVNGFSDNISNCFNNCPFPDFFYRNVTGAFTGSGESQTTVVDLEAYLGREIMVRFNYISLLFQDELRGAAWSIDDFELYERRELAGQTCIMSNGQTLVCDDDFTLINSNSLIDPVTEVVTDELSISVRPNPADQLVTLNLESRERLEGSLRIVGIDGRVIDQRSLVLSSGTHQWQENVGRLSPGMYFIEIIDETQRYTVAFIKQ